MLAASIGIPDLAGGAERLLMLPDQFDGRVEMNRNEAKLNRAGVNRTKNELDLVANLAS